MAPRYTQPAAPGPAGWPQGEAYKVSQPRLERYNAFPALNMFGEAAPGRSSDEAMQAMEDIVSRLFKGIGFDWTGLSYQDTALVTNSVLLVALPRKMADEVLATHFTFQWTI